MVQKDQKNTKVNFEDEIAVIASLNTTIQNKLQEFIVGNQDLIQLILVALLSEGHILIEGVPGTAKTTIAKSISKIIGAEFKRVQGAIDIQPTDVIGVRIYDAEKKDFSLKKGPIFTNILLADELNRMNPKSQSAFIESMSENQATIDGITIPLPRPFIVIATQNPYELEGTFPLIEVQRDRFMFSISTAQLGPEEELQIIQRISAGKLSWSDYANSIKTLIEQDALIRFISIVSSIRIEEPINRYIRDIIIATRNHPDVGLGASTRASVAFVQGVKALAALRGRTYVIPDDVKWIARTVLLHRIYLTREAEIEGVKPNDIIQEILDTIEVQ